MGSSQTVWALFLDSNISPPVFQNDEANGIEEECLTETSQELLHALFPFLTKWNGYDPVVKDMACGVDRVPICLHP